MYGFLYSLPNVLYIKISIQQGVFLSISIGAASLVFLTFFQSLSIWPCRYSDVHPVLFLVVQDHTFFLISCQTE